MDFVVMLFGAIFGILVILEFLFVLGIFVPHSVLLVTCFGLVVIQFRTSFSVHHQLARFSSWVCGLLVGVEHDIHDFMGTGSFFMSYSCCLRCDDDDDDDDYYYC